MTNRDGFPDFIRKSFTYNYSLDIYSVMDVTKTLLNWSENPSGYTVFTCAAYSTGNKNVSISKIDPTNNYVFRIFNRTDATVTGTVTLRVIFVRTGFAH